MMLSGKARGLKCRTVDAGGGLAQLNWQKGNVSMRLQQPLPVAIVLLISTGCLVQFTCMSLLTWISLLELVILSQGIPDARLVTMNGVSRRMDSGISEQQMGN